MRRAVRLVPSTSASAFRRFSSGAKRSSWSRAAATPHCRSATIRTISRPKNSACWLCPVVAGAGALLGVAPATTAYSMTRAPRLTAPSAAAPRQAATRSSSSPTLTTCGGAGRANGIVRPTHLRLSLLCAQILKRQATRPEALLAAICRSGTFRMSHSKSSPALHSPVTLTESWCKMRPSRPTGPKRAVTKRSAAVRALRQRQQGSASSKGGR
mmetsp:Transcript_64954/g.209178  ORF Transcript_64954/g.209178 Transcript_64954/m.209178 type:complete len:213 (+) Transcript_64954:2571-3209(+)